MDTLTVWLFLGLGLAWLAGFGYFAWVSWCEHEPRAWRISALSALLGGALLSGAAALPFQGRLALLTLIHLAGLMALILFWWPIGRTSVIPDTPHRRFDERQILFARARLRPGTPAYQAYYDAHPEHQQPDNHTRTLPGLMAPGARFFDALQFASPQGSFFLTDALRPAATGAPAAERTVRAPQAMSDYLKSLAGYFGALQVGITELRPYHFYSHIGRGTGEYGAEIPFEPGYALVFTVEMDFEMVASAPRGPTLMESARQYVESGRVAVQLAAAIRALGYQARAHIDGNYQVIAPLVARDAGLGEIGRISLLMTPAWGPRVRIGVVTTDLPLLTDRRDPDPALIDFCNLCQKCANNCPSKSIPTGERTLEDGVLRWKLDPDSCFRYWNMVGTDCGRCLAVCPYSHPNNPAHNLVRWGIARSGAFRRLALWLDDLFYGKHPKPHPLPRWTQVQAARPALDPPSADI